MRVSPIATQFRARTRSGCLTCRTRKVKCDETRPICFNCRRLSRTCVYKETPRRKKIVVPTTSTDPVSNVARPDASNSISSNDPYINQILQEQDFFLQGQLGGISNFDSDGQIYSTADLSLPSAFDIINPSVDLDCEDPSSLLAGNLTQNPSYEVPELQEKAPPAYSVSSSRTDSTFRYFLDHVDPPFLSPYDSINCARIKLYIAELGFHNALVASAIAAVESLYEAEMNSQDTNGSMALYYAAKSGYSKMLEDEQQDLHTILVVTLLLCCFEIVAQQETVSITLKSQGAFIRKLEMWPQHASWPPISRRIEAWLRILHAKAMHLGGRGLISPQVDDLLPTDHHSTMSLSFLDVNVNVESAIYDSLSGSLFEFFLDLQRLSIQTSSLNRHHRSRGTASDEEEVRRISADIKSKLYTVWYCRPVLLRISTENFAGHLSPSLASSLTSLVGICTASYFTEIIYLGRACGETLTATVEAQRAMQQIRQIIDSNYASDTEQVNSGYLFPLYLYACESIDREDCQWAITKLRQIKNPLCHSDVIADLAEALTQEQLEKGDRVDTRYFCLKVFGLSPPFI